MMQTENYEKIIARLWDAARFANPYNPSIQTPNWNKHGIALHLFWTTWKRHY